VFVNRRLAVDLGGIHTAQTGSVTISGTNNYGMTTGNVYEIVVFQAERQKTSSTYQLTL
jgi:fibro-slime domain-containing protein